MENLILEIVSNAGLIISQLVVALLILLLYLPSPERMSFSKTGIVFYGALHSMDRSCQMAWAMSLSRFLLVVFCALNPDKAGICYGVGLLLLTVVLNLVAGDMQGMATQCGTYIAIFLLLLLQGLFYDYYHEIEEEPLILAVVVLLGMFPVLYSLYQTVKGHERLIWLSGETLRQEVNGQAMAKKAKKRAKKAALKNKLKHRKESKQT